jgi:thiol-disulfide isomerase/thioredoxin
VKRPSWWLVALVTVCAATGFAAYRQLMLTHAPATIQAVPLDETVAATPPADGTARPKVPDTVPDIALHDVSGKQRRLKEFSGQPTIINFWATWCIPCRREIPLLNELRKVYASPDRSRRLEVVGIAVDFKESVAEYVTKTRIDYPLLVGEQDGVEAAARFGMELVLPFSIFVDRRDRIVAVKVGELHRPEADAILAAMSQLDAGTLDLATARQNIATRLRELSAERARKAPQTG